MGILPDEERTRTEELDILEVGFSSCVVSVGRSERWFWHLPAFSGNCDTHFPTFAFLSISRRQFFPLHFHFFHFHFHISLKIVIDNFLDFKRKKFGRIEIATDADLFQIKNN